MVRKQEKQRRGAAAVELAILLPFLVFLVMIGTDFARIFFYSQTIANCARNGAIYESNPYESSQSTYASVTEAALADASNIIDPANPPSVTSTSLKDADGNNYVKVTVAYQFRTVTGYLGAWSKVDLTRTVLMRVEPPNPEW